MKKMVFIFLFVILFASLFASATFAGSIGVQVYPGFALTLDKIVQPESEDWFVTACYGFNENLMLRGGYGDEIYSFGGRYVIVKNLAMDFDASYFNREDIIQWYVDLRGKIHLTDELDWSGIIGYSYQKIDTAKNLDAIKLITQVEYRLGESGAFNLGLGHWNSGNESTNYYVVGAEVYIDKVCLYLDYTASLDSTALFDNVLLIGMEIAF